MRIRAYQAADFPAVKAWETDARTHALWCAGRFPYPLAEDDFATVLADHAAKHGDKAYIAETENGGPAGFFCMSKKAETGIVMLRFVIISPQMRGRGYGREMLRLAADYAFDVLHADAVRLVVFTANAAAKACYLRAGFTEQHTEDNAFSFGGETWGRCVMIQNNPAGTETI